MNKQTNEMVISLSRVQDVGIRIIESQMDSRNAQTREISNETVAKHLIEEGFCKRIVAEWLPYFEDVEIYNAGGFTERRQTGWICGNCKKGFSLCPRNFCDSCGAKMKGTKK